MHIPIKTNRGAGRIKQTIGLMPPALEKLHMLAEIQRDIHAQHLRNIQPHVILPRSPSEWFHTDEGHDKFMELRAENKLHEYDNEFRKWHDARALPGAATDKLRNKFPLPSCAGDVIERMLERYGVALLAEMQNEYSTAVQEGKYQFIRQDV